MAPSDPPNDQRDSRAESPASTITGALPEITLGQKEKFGMIFSNRPTSDIKEIVELLIAHVIGIVGAVTGFYFGSSGVNANRGPEL
jgi:hypothetical protein